MYERAVQTGMEDAQRTVQLDPDSGAAVSGLRDLSHDPAFYTN